MISAQYVDGLEQRIRELEMRIHNAYEVYAGSEGIPVPETCVEAYLLQIITEMVKELKPPNPDRS